MLQHKITARGGDPNALNDDGIPLLCLAVAKTRNAEVVEVLLEHGAKVDVGCADGVSIYATAAIHSDLPTLKLLFEYGGAPSPSEINKMLNSNVSRDVREYLKSY